MKPGLRQFSLGSLMIAIAVFAVVLANPGLTANFLIGAVAPIRLMVVLVAFIIVVLVVFNYLVLAPCLWLIAVVERRLGASRDDGREP
jgi:hypothetical protein